MAIKITNSLDWQLASAELRREVATIKNGHRRLDATRMLNNLDPMITKLSQLELTARRSATHSTRMVEEQLDLINESVLTLEQWILLCLLM